MAALAGVEGIYTTGAQPIFRLSSCVVIDVPSQYSLYNEAECLD